VVPEESGIAPDLAEARPQPAEGQLLPALSKYNRMIEANQDLERIIQDLQEASSTFPEQSGVWQELGDAYLRTGQIQEALRAYIKAEELL